MSDGDNAYEESCSCGASISIPKVSSPWRAGILLTEWRRQHRHEFPAADASADRVNG